MTGTTPVFGWTIPVDSDQIAAGPADIAQGLKDIENTLIITQDSKAGTDDPTTWPKGVSIMGMTGAAPGWPSGNGTIMTVHRPSDARTYQLFFSGNTVPPTIMVRSGASTGWNSWRQIVSDGTPIAMASGQVTGSPPSGGGTVNINVNFPAGRFSGAPRVAVWINNSTKPEECACSVTSVTASGCTIVLHRTNNTDTSVGWQAIQGVE